MKKLEPLLIILLITVILTGCAKETKELTPKDKYSDVREAVYEQLSENDKSNIIGTWKDAVVTEQILDSKIIIEADKKNMPVSKYEGKKVYNIDFTLDVPYIPNNMTVVAAMDTYEIIGYGLLD